MRRGYRSGLALVALALAVTGCDPRTGRSAGPATPGVNGSATPGVTGPVAPSRASTAAASGQPALASPNDPASLAAPVRRYAKAAGISAQLLMAILYNEDYKPHDPALERAWQRIKPDAAFGVANMHKAAFDDTKRGRDFAGRDWQELPDDPELAVEAAAWYLHDLAAELPAHWSAGYTRDELLALGYNAGGGSMRAFARGAQPGSVAQSYLDRLHANWATAGKAVG